MDALSARSPAKINLTLQVGTRRADGFHDLESIVALIGLYDDITVSPRSDSAFALDCDDPSIPCDDSNLALRAARALAAKLGRVPCGVDIRLAKRIPAGAGLGGGSSNAATVLSLLNRLWHARLPRDELAALGATLGSDVPLFLGGPLCIMRGRGEQVEVVSASCVSAILLVVPPIHSATAAVYAAFDSLPPPPAREPAADLIRRVSRENLSLPGGPRQIAGPELLPHLFNDLEPAARQVNPPLHEFAAQLHAATGNMFHMSGSGSTYYRLYDKYTDRREFERLRCEIAAVCGPVQIAQTFILT